MIAWLNCLVINEDFSSSINVLANFVPMFATRLVAIRFIISNGIPDYKMTKVGRLFGSVYWRLNKDTSNLPIIFQNAAIRFNVLNEKVDLRTEFSD